MSKQKKPANKIRRQIGQGSGIDWLLVLIVIVLLVFGLIMLYSASSYNSQIKFGTSAWYVKKQLYSTLIGIAGMFVVAYVPLNFWKKIAYPLYIVAAIAILLILTPLGGEEINGAKRWLDLKIVSVQPAEIMKIALIVAMALFISTFIKYLDNLMNKNQAYILSAEDTFALFEEFHKQTGLPYPQTLSRSKENAPYYFKDEETLWDSLFFWRITKGENFVQSHLDAILRKYQ